MFSQLLRKKNMYKHDQPDESVEKCGHCLMPHDVLKSLSRSAHLSHVNLVAKSFDVKEGHGKRALDVGCGYGYGMGLFRDFGYEVYGTDISEHVLKKARNNVDKGAILMVHDIQNPLPFDIKFDLITCFEVLEHLKSPESAVENCYHALKPGGLFIASTPNRLSPVTLIERDEEHINVRSAYKWRRCFDRLGWSDLKIFYRQWIPVIWRLPLRKLRHKSIFFPLPYLGVSLLIIAKK